MDFHCHTRYSDGSLSPEQVVTTASTNGVKTLAITDHDTIDGVLSLWPKRKQLAVELIAGVEISTQWQGKDIHIVGLNFDPYSKPLQQFLIDQQQLREQRAQVLMEKLHHRLGIEQVELKIKRLAQGSSICRSHFASLIVNEGKASCFSKAFSKFLAKGKICSVKSQWPSVELAVAQIKQAGGVAVLAHSTRYKLSNSRTYQLLKDFSEVGGAGVEVSYPAIKAQDQRRLIRIAHEFKLMGSLGSDFHHLSQTWANLGQVAPLPADIKPIWELF